MPALCETRVVLPEVRILCETSGSLNILLRNGFGTGAGCGRSAGKVRKRIGSGSEELRSGREAEGLGFNSCVAPSCTQVSYFGKPSRQKTETGGTEVNIQTGDTGGNT